MEAQIRSSRNASEAATDRALAVLCLGGSILDRFCKPLLLLLGAAGSCSHVERVLERAEARLCGWGLVRWQPNAT